MVKDWPEGVPKWKPYLCWQVGASEPDAIKALKKLASQEFKRRHGYVPEFVFYRLRAIYVGPVRGGQK